MVLCKTRTWNKFPKVNEYQLTFICYLWTNPVYPVKFHCNANQGEKTRAMTLRELAFKCKMATNVLIISLKYTTESHKAIVHDLNVCNTHVTFKWGRTRRSTICNVTSALVVLKQSQSHQTGEEFVDLMQGYSHAKFERPDFDSVRENVNQVFIKSETRRLSPLNTSESRMWWYFHDLVKQWLSWLSHFAELKQGYNHAKVRTTWFWQCPWKLNKVFIKSETRQLSPLNTCESRKWWDFHDWVNVI